jgi:hypothetical protein
VVLYVHQASGPAEDTGGTARGDRSGAAMMVASEDFRVGAHPISRQVPQGGWRGDAVW